LKTFYCIHCRVERPIEKKLLIGRNVRCTVCEAGRQHFKRTGKYTGAPYGRAVGHKQDSWEAENPLPDFIIESHRESLGD
jgi:hypothetical protein